MAFKHSTFPLDPPVSIFVPKIAHFKGFWELAWANMGKIWLKIALNHLFEHPKWFGANFGKKSFLTIFGPTSEPRNPTLARAP